MTSPNDRFSIEINYIRNINLELYKSTLVRQANENEIGYVVCYYELKLCLYLSSSLLCEYKFGIRSGKAKFNFTGLFILGNLSSRYLYIFLMTKRMRRGLETFHMKKVIFVHNFIL